MTVSSTENRKEYAGNGVTTAFATLPVVFFVDADLTVYVVNDTTGAVTDLVLDTDYTVSGGDGSAGTVDTSGGSSPYGAPATGETLVIVRDLAITQGSDFVNNDSSDAEVAEDALDRLTMIAQQLDARIDRSFTLADSDISGASTVIPTPVASTIIGWNSAGTALQNYAAGDIAPDISVSVFMETVLDDVDAATARTTLDAAEKVITTKGDLYVGGAAGAESRKAVGTAGYGLCADPGSTDGLSYIAPPISVSGRLTLTSATPITAADVTGATTVYYTPYKGNVVELYDGNGWFRYAFAELSQATTDDTKSPAAVANNSNYDVFVWNDNGTLRATRGPAWTSDTGRGTGAATTELELFEGRYVNKIAITNGPAARRGLYVGTIRSDGSAQINDSMALRHVWNMYNRVLRALRNPTETTNTWAYSNTTRRQANANTANQLDVVRGLDEDLVRAIARHTCVSASAGKVCYTGVGLNSTTANAAGTHASYTPISIAGDTIGLTAEWIGYPGIGRHYLAWLEEGDGSGGTTTFYGDGGQPTKVQTGISGEMLA